jgi:carboxyl-terminal processing protease
VNNCKDFSYVIEDVLKAKDRIAKNRITLNIGNRQQELADSEARQKERNAERRARFEETATRDKQAMKFFKITLDDLDQGAELRAYDPSEESGSFMRRAKDEEEDLDQTPKWPTGLDPVKRESLAVLGDLVELSENARLAGMIK